MLRKARPENSICVDLSGTDAGHESVPIMIGAVRARIELDHARWLRRSDVIEQQQLKPTGLPRKHTEIDAVCENCRAQRETSSRLVDVLSYGARVNFRPKVTLVARYHGVTHGAFGNPQDTARFPPLLKVRRASYRASLLTSPWVCRPALGCDLASSRWRRLLMQASRLGFSRIAKFMFGL